MKAASCRGADQRPGLVSASGEGHTCLVGLTRSLARYPPKHADHRQRVHIEHALDSGGLRQDMPASSSAFRRRLAPRNFAPNRMAPVRVHRDAGRTARWMASELVWLDALGREERQFSAFEHGGRHRDAAPGGVLASVGFPRTGLACESNKNHYSSCSGFGRNSASHVEKCSNGATLSTLWSAAGISPCRRRTTRRRPIALRWLRQAPRDVFGRNAGVFPLRAGSTTITCLS